MDCCDIGIGGDHDDDGQISEACSYFLQILLESICQGEETIVLIRLIL